MRSHSIRRILPLSVLLIAVIAAVIYLYSISWAQEDGTLEASGTVEAVEVVIASEAGGRVAEVFVEEGALVQPGDPLFRLEDDLLIAQRRRALTILESAQVNLDLAQKAERTAQSSVTSARIQYRLTVNAARLEEQPLRTNTWQVDVPSDFDLPIWYFSESEQMAAAEAETISARDALELERASFEAVSQQAGNADLRAAEIRLAQAQRAFLVAQEILDRAAAQDDTPLDQFAQSIFDTAQAELESAQLAYDQILSEGAADEVLEARARLAVAQERYDTALDHQALLLSGEHSLQVQAARAALQQAEAQADQASVGVLQAEKAIAQAEAELDLIDLQIDKLTVRAAVFGVVLVRSVEPGEVVAAGAPAVTTAQLDDLTITVYISEERYGEINIGQRASVKVDSFPNQTFTATVVRIADRAEFTPRNVQTEEGRRTTVFAVELSVEDPVGRLKPGMPADVSFGE
jgi:HlyD family secretion protein